MGGWFFNSYKPNIPFSKTVNRPIAALSSPCKTMSTTGQSEISASRVLHLTTDWRFNGFWSFFTAWVSPQLFYVCVALTKIRRSRKWWLENDGSKSWDSHIVVFSYLFPPALVSHRITVSQWVKTTILPQLQLLQLRLFWSFTKKQQTLPSKGACYMMSSKICARCRRLSKRLH